MTPRRAGPDYPRWGEVLVLLRDAFAYMESRLGRPSPVAHLTEARLAADAGLGPAFVVEQRGRPVACLFCRPSRDVADALYIGRLAVVAEHRGAGLARRLVAAAETAAREAGAAALTLDTGAALTELHEAFRRLGFRISDRAPGGEPEVVTMLKPLNPRGDCNDRPGGASRVGRDPEAP